jgi:hypothetical protein
MLISGTEYHVDFAKIAVRMLQCADFQKAEDLLNEVQTKVQDTQTQAQCYFQHQENKCLLFDLDVL